MQNRTVDATLDLSLEMQWVLSEYSDLMQDDLPLGLQPLWNTHHIHGLHACHQVLFDVGDYVWVVLNRDRFPVREYTKLRDRKIDCCEIVQKINDNTYRLCLPSHLKISIYLTWNTFVTVEWILLIRLWTWGRVLLNSGWLIQRYLIQMEHNCSIIPCC